jgi:hypothetical protein
MVYSKGVYYFTTKLLTELKDSSCDPFIQSGSKNTKKSAFL